MDAFMAISRFSYHQRMMGSMVVVLVLAIALVRWWPTWTASNDTRPFRDRATDRIQIQDIQPTSQSKERNPPPPAPLPPVVVPNDVLVEEEFEIGESRLQVETPEDDQKLQEGADQATAARQPQTGARLLRNVQPNYPDAARDEEVRARIEIEVKIGKTGRVQNVSIRRRWRLPRNGSPQPVSTLDYGLEEAALQAARQSLFRPAQANGHPVSTRKVITFTFGPK